MNTQLTAQAPRINLSFEAMVKPIVCYLNRYLNCRRSMADISRLNEHLRQDAGLRDTFVTATEARDNARRLSDPYSLEHPIRYSIWSYSS